MPINLTLFSLHFVAQYPLLFSGITISRTPTTTLKTKTTATETTTELRGNNRIPLATMASPGTAAVLARHFPAFFFYIPRGG